MGAFCCGLNQTRMSLQDKNESRGCGSMTRKCYDRDRPSVGDSPVVCQFGVSRRTVKTGALRPFVRCESSQSPKRNAVLSGPAVELVFPLEVLNTQREINGGKGIRTPGLFIANDALQNFSPDRKSRLRKGIRCRFRFDARPESTRFAPLMNGGMSTSVRKVTWHPDNKRETELGLLFLEGNAPPFCKLFCCYCGTEGQWTAIRSRQLGGYIEREQAPLAQLDW